MYFLNLGVKGLTTSQPSPSPSVNAPLLSSKTMREANKSQIIQPTEQPYSHWAITSTTGTSNEKRFLYEWTLLLSALSRKVCCLFHNDYNCQGKWKLLLASRLSVGHGTQRKSCLWPWTVALNWFQWLNSDKTGSYSWINSSAIMMVYQEFIQSNAAVNVYSSAKDSLLLRLLRFFVLITLVGNSLKWLQTRPHLTQRFPRRKWTSFQICQVRKLLYWWKATREKKATCFARDNSNGLTGLY